MPTIEQQPTIELTQQRKAAEVSLADAQRKSAAALAAVEELQSKLQTETEFRKKLQKKYDDACVAEDQDGASAFDQEIQRANFRARGLELKLAAANQELSKCREAEVRTGEDLSQAMSREAIATEGVELTKMIESANGAYEEVVRASEQLEAALLALQNKQWLDPKHKHAASDATFKLTSKIKGFNF